MLPEKKTIKKNRKIRHRFSDTATTTTKELNQSDKQRSESFPNPITTASVTQQKYPLTAPNPESSTPNTPYTGAISKLADTFGTTSQDSGINMSFQDPDDRSKVRTTSTDGDR